MVQSKAMSMFPAEQSMSRKSNWVKRQTLPGEPVTVMPVTWVKYFWENWKPNIIEES